MADLAEKAMTSMAVVDQFASATQSDQERRAVVMRVKLRQAQMEHEARLATRKEALRDLRRRLGESKDALRQKEAKLPRNYTQQSAALCQDVLDEAVQVERLTSEIAGLEAVFQKEAAEGGATFMAMGLPSNRAAMELSMSPQHKRANETEAFEAEGNLFESGFFTARSEQVQRAKYRAVAAERSPEAAPVAPPAFMCIDKPPERNPKDLPEHRGLHVGWTPGLVHAASVRDFIAHDVARVLVTELTRVGAPGSLHVLDGAARTGKTTTAVWAAQRPCVRDFFKDGVYVVARKGWLGELISLSTKSGEDKLLPRSHSMLSRTVQGMSRTGGQAQGNRPASIDRVEATASLTPALAVKYLKEFWAGKQVLIVVDGVAPDDSEAPGALCDLLAGSKHKALVTVHGHLPAISTSTAVACERHTLQWTLHETTELLQKAGGIPVHKATGVLQALQGDPFLATLTACAIKEKLKGVTIESVCEFVETSLRTSQNNTLIRRKTRAVPTLDALVLEHVIAHLPKEALRVLPALGCLQYTGRGVSLSVVQRCVDIDEEDLLRGVLKLSSLALVAEVHGDSYDRVRRVLYSPHPVFQTFLAERYTAEIADRHRHLFEAVASGGYVAAAARLADAPDDNSVSVTPRPSPPGNAGDPDVDAYFFSFLLSHMRAAGQAEEDIAAAFLTIRSIAGNIDKDRLASYLKQLEGVSHASFDAQLMVAALRYNQPALSHSCGGVLSHLHAALAAHPATPRAKLLLTLLKSVCARSTSKDIAAADNNPFSRGVLWAKYHPSPHRPWPAVGSILKTPALYLLEARDTALLAPATMPASRGSRGPLQALPQGSWGQRQLQCAALSCDGRRMYGVVRDTDTIVAEQHQKSHRSFLQVWRVQDLALVLTLELTAHLEAPATYMATTPWHTVLVGDVAGNVHEWYTAKSKFARRVTEGVFKDHRRALYESGGREGGSAVAYIHVCYPPDLAWGCGSGAFGATAGATGTTTSTADDNVDEVAEPPGMKYLVFFRNGRSAVVGIDDDAVDATSPRAPPVVRPPSTVDVGVDIASPVLSVVHGRYVLIAGESTEVVCYTLAEDPTDPIYHRASAIVEGASVVYRFTADVMAAEESVVATTCISLDDGASWRGVFALRSGSLCVLQGRVGGHTRLCRTLPGHATACIGVVWGGTSQVISLGDGELRVWHYASEAGAGGAMLADDASDVDDDSMAQPVEEWPMVQQDALVALPGDRFVSLSGMRLKLFATGGGAGAARGGDGYASSDAASSIVDEELDDTNIVAHAEAPRAALVAAADAGEVLFVPAARRGRGGDDGGDAPGRVYDVATSVGKFKRHVPRAEADGAVAKAEAAAGGTRHPGKAKGVRFRDLPATSGKDAAGWTVELSVRGSDGVSLRHGGATRLGLELTRPVDAAIVVETRNGRTVAVVACDDEPHFFELLRYRLDA